MRTSLVIPKAQTARLERLAEEARRSPKQMLRFVLRDGFDYTEEAVRKIKQGLKQARRGELISHSQAMKTVRSAIEKHATRRKKAA
ncbi:MAG: CopG family ribbon-helix-helix protein [Burkholderiales bacterium]